jgi:Tfp pilus assembly protein PilF
VALDGERDQDQAHPKAPGAAAADFTQPSTATARALIEKGDFRKARLMLEELVKGSPDAEALLLLAQLEIDNPKRAASALEHLKQAVVIAPDYTEAWLTLANYWGLRRQADKQRRCLEKVLAYNPANKDVRMALELLGPAK